ncbi:hypothetical protein PMIN06_001077 [Paraphaeosphaeria minitans]
MTRRGRRAKSGDNTWADETHLGAGGGNWEATEAEDNTTKPGQAEEKGFKCEIKEVFHVESKQPGIFCWEDEKPAYPEKTEDGRHEQWNRDTCAIVKSNIYDKVKKEWITSQIDIRNSEIKSALEKILEGYPGQT